MLGVMERALMIGVIPTTLETARRRQLPFIPEGGFPKQTSDESKLSLRALQSDVRDQGQGGYCASFAVSGCAEFPIRNGLHGSFPVWDIHLSEAHLTHATEKRHGDCQPGLELWQALETISFYGVVTADVWPYNVLVTCNPNPPDRSQATWYRVRPWALFNLVENSQVRALMDRYAKGEKPVHSYYSAATLRGYLLAQHAPVLIDIPVFLGNGWDEPTDGTIAMPTHSQLSHWLKMTDDLPTDPPGSRGWHAIGITGFDDATQRFEFKNSWGPDWGNGGYGTLPYDYVAAFSRQVWANFSGYVDRRIGPFPGAI